VVIYLATIVGLVLWIVLWALNVKAFDAFLLTMLIVLGACVAHIIAPYLPGNRGDEPRPPGA
jgi:Mn2+/Fe2+ NRAMP family transporter